MRYLSWDVLLFPGSSRVPLQEFDTKCHVLSDRNNRFVDNAALNNNPYLTDAESMSQIPVLTSFVSSLENGIPFRVSVHSWEPPRPSQILRTFKAPEESVAYEARIYVDGHMVAHRLFDEHSIWPEVIDSTGNIDTTHPKPLRFPAFHSEILDQAHWEPGEMHGRIRIVLAEGVTRQRVVGKASSVFDRLRDVVAFSFQHAPKHVLEHSGIAWPSSRMFLHTGRLLPGNIVNRVTTVPDFEAHAHSPQRRKAHNFAMPFSESGTSTSMFTNFARTTDNSNCEDPFIGPVPISLRGKQSQVRNGSRDASIKDYSSIRTVRSHAGTDMSGVSYQKPNFEKAMNEAAIEEIVQALSPERKHELLEALSPTRTLSGDKLRLTVHDPELTTAMSLEAQEPTHETPVPVQATSEYRFPSSGLRGNFATSRYSSVPLLTPSTMLPRTQRSFLGLRTSVDPLLTNQWESAKANNETSFGQTRSLLELRPRSSSNASKRKRFDSPSSYALVEPFNVPSMSTSPCKRSDITPNNSKNQSPIGLSEGIASINDKK